MDIRAILLKPTREWTKEERDILTAEIKKSGRQRLKNMRTDAINEYGEAHNEYVNNDN